MNRMVIVALFILIALIIGIFTYTFLGPGQALAPIASIEPTTSPLATPSSSPTACEKIQVVTPKDGSKVTFPFNLEIKVDNRCGWTIFEAQAGVATVLQNGNELGVFPLQVDGDWMQAGQFNSKVSINPKSLPAKGAFELEIMEEDPSGMGEADSITLKLFY